MPSKAFLILLAFDSLFSSLFKGSDPLASRSCAQNVSPWPFLMAITSLNAIVSPLDQWMIRQINALTYQARPKSFGEGREIGPPVIKVA